MINKHKIKYIKILLFVVTFVLLSSTFTFGATRLDLSSKKIISKNGDYYFKIPISWESYIYAEREASEGYAYLDKINFYYVPRDVGNKNTKFLTLYTYYVEDYTGFSGQKKILTTDKYVFTVSNQSTNPYDSVNDRIIFSRFLIEMETANFLSSKIYISADKNNVVQKGTLTVNNAITDVKPQMINSEIYLPLRASSEKLGYSVSWVPSTKNIVLKKGSKTIVVPTIQSKSNYKILNKNGTIFMPITFFIQKLNVDLDIDSNNNVKIKG